MTTFTLTCTMSDVESNQNHVYWPSVHFKRRNLILNYSGVRNGLYVWWS